jgi:hypothetical protein
LIGHHFGQSHYLRCNHLRLSVINRLCRRLLLCLCLCIRR